MATRTIDVGVVPSGRYRPVMVTEMSIGCAVFAAARALASWVGSGRAVTADGALKPALVPEAAEAIGVGCPAKVRRLSDVPEAHRAWLTALAAGLITISGTRAAQDKNVAEPDITVWYAALERVVGAQVTDPCATSSPARRCCSSC